MGENQSKPPKPKPQFVVHKAAYSITDFENMVQKYTGSDKESVFVLIQQIEHVQAEYGVNDRDLKLLIARKLDGKALDWYQSKPAHVMMPVNQLLEELRRTFGSVSVLQKQFQAFHERKWRWRQNEEFFIYYTEKLQLGASLGLPEMQMVTFLIDGMDNREWENQARAQNIRQASILLQKVESAKQYYQSSQPLALSKAAKSVPNLANVGRPPITCNYCKKPNHVEAKCFKKKNDEQKVFEKNIVEGFKELSEKLESTSLASAPPLPGPAKKAPRPKDPSGPQKKPQGQTNFCTNCHRTGHTADVCQHEALEKGKCFNCGSADHMRNNCPYLKSSAGVPKDKTKKTDSKTPGPPPAKKKDPKTPGPPPTKKTGPKEQHPLFHVE